MTSPARVFAILDLFTRERPTWHADEINEALGYSRATGYRYVRELVEAGFLQKVTAGRYGLGARIIELDYQLRQSDPLLLAAAPLMPALVATAGLDAVLSAMFGPNRIIDTHRERAAGGLELQYGRGRPRPLLRGASPRVLVAHLPRAALLRLYEAHAAEIAELGHGATWAEFRTRMAALRNEGMALSLGELDPGVGAAAVPIFNGEDEVVGALALVGTVQRLHEIGNAQLCAWLDDAASGIRAALAAAPRG